MSDGGREGVLTPEKLLMASSLKDLANGVSALKVSNAAQKCFLVLVRTDAKIASSGSTILFLRKCFFTGLLLLAVLPCVVQPACLLSDPHTIFSDGGCDWH